MKLTIVNQFYKPDISPTAHMAASLAEHRAARGDRVTVIAGAGGYLGAGAATESAPASNPRVLRTWTPGLGKRTIAARLTDYGAYYALAAQRLGTLPAQDAIVCLTTPPFIACAALLHKALHRSTRLVLWSMDCYPEVAERARALAPGGRASAAMRAINRLLFRRLDHLVCLDGAMRDLLVPQYAPRQDLPVTVIPNWERAALFPPGATVPPWDGRAEGIDLAGRLVVLYLGNAGAGHEFGTVLDAAHELRSDPVTFLFVGGGSGWEGLRRAAAERGLGNVVLRGYIPKEQTPSMMAAADCALITLRDDMLGVMSPSKLHAGLAMGLPVVYVGPRGSNVDEAVERHRCGVSLRHGDAAGLVGFVRALRADAEQLRLLRRRARAAFDDAYRDDRALARFDAVLDGLRAPASSAR